MKADQHQVVLQMTTLPNTHDESEYFVLRKEDGSPTVDPVVAPPVDTIPVIDDSLMARILFFGEWPRSKNII